jgi:hypothetical protein
MPYIPKDKRPDLDAKMEALIDHLSRFPLEEQDGALNYTITRMIKRIYPIQYRHLNRALGVLTAVTQELYRRVIGPYEDKKIKENGDV